MLRSKSPQTRPSHESATVYKGNLVRTAAIVPKQNDLNVSSGVRDDTPHYRRELKDRLQLLSRNRHLTH